MKAKSLILILIALGCGSVAAVGATQVLENRKVSVEAQTEKILVAMTDVSIGNQFNEQNVKLEEWPKDRIPQGAVRDLKTIQGKYSSQRLYKGEPILAKKVMGHPKVASITIPKGYRVISVKVNVDSGGSGLVKPGDKVDLIVFLKRGKEVPVTGTYRFLRNVTVFAVNTKTERSVDTEGKPILAKTVSLLVKPIQVQKVALVSRLGTMHLSLRRPDDDTQESDKVQSVSLKDLFAQTDDAASDSGDSAPPVLPELPQPTFEQDVEPIEKWQVEMISPQGRSRVSFSGVSGATSAMTRWEMDPVGSPAPIVTPAAVEPAATAPTDHSGNDAPSSAQGEFGDSFADDPENQ